MLVLCVSYGTSANQCFFSFFLTSHSFPKITADDVIISFIIRLTYQCVFNNRFKCVYIFSDTVIFSGDVIDIDIPRISLVKHL